MVVVVYVLAGATDGLVAGWSASLKAVVGVGLVVVVLTGRRFFARDLAEADLARVRAAAARKSGASIPTRPIASIASAAPDNPPATAATAAPLQGPEDTTAFATYLTARNALEDVIASTDTPVMTSLEPNPRHVPAVNTGMTHSESSLAASTADLREAAREIADVCALVAERVEVDRLDRRAFADALMALAQRAWPSVSPRPPLRARSTPATPAPSNGEGLVLVNADAGSPAEPSLR